MTHLPALAVALPFLVAAALMGAGRVLPRRLLDTLGLLTAAATLAACAVLAARSVDGAIVYWFGGWRPRSGVAPGIAFVIDPLGAGLAALAAALTTAALGYSWRYFDAAGALYHALMLVFLGGMVGFCLTGDLFNLFVFFELMSVAAYALTGYKIEEEESLEGALNFAVVNSLGGFLVLTGIGLLYGRTGALNLAQIGRALAGGPADGLVVAAFVLTASGFCVKGALAPFHFWLPDAHAVAPTPVSLLFSGVMVELGAYAVARVYWTAFAGPLGPHAGAVGGILLGMGVLTALLGAVLCASQRHLKRLLAFSTVSHMGLMLVGVALLTPRALAGTAVYAVGHGLVKGALFLGVGVLLHRHSTVDEGELWGQGRGLPWAGTAFALAGLGLAGLPPFATHPGKELIEEAARRAGHGWVVPVLMAGSALTAGAVLRAAARIFLGWGPPPRADIPAPRGHEERETRGDGGGTPPVMMIPMAALVALALAAGLAPDLAERASAAAERFVDREGYAARVLDEAPGPPSSRTRSEPRASGGLIAALLPAAGAVAVALAALSFHRLPPSWRDRLSRAVRPPLVRVKALHSGRAGDYVAWLVVGVALFAILVAAFVR